MAQRHNFQDLEETGEALVAFIASSQPESLRRLRREQQALLDQQTDVARTVSLILNAPLLSWTRLVLQEAEDVAQTEESMSQKLLDAEQRNKELEEELQSLEQQLRQSSARSQTTHSELQLLQRELDGLRSSEGELSALQSQVDEDTTELIPSSVFVAQLFYVITKIRWEYDTEPSQLRGVHYGADLATPISIDRSTRSRADVSDQLWGFISPQ